MVTFRIKDESTLTTASRAEIRFLNLVGDRYLALEQGAATRRRAARAPTTPSRSTTPARRSTSPCCSTASSRCSRRSTPSRSTSLSLNLVQVLQGEGGTVAGLLQKTASLTNTPGRPRPADRRGDHQPQPDPGHRRPAPPAAERADRRAEGLDGRPRPRPRARSATRWRTSPTSPTVVADLVRRSRPLRQGRRRRAAPAAHTCSTSRRTARPSSTCSTGCRSR